MLTVHAWNILGGEIEYGMLGLAVEMLGIQDVEGLVLGLITIRNHQRQRASNG